MEIIILSGPCFLKQDQIENIQELSSFCFFLSSFHFTEPWYTLI